MPTSDDIGGKIGELVSLLVQSGDPKAHDLLEKMVKELREYMGTGDTDLAGEPGDGTGIDEAASTKKEEEEEKESPVTESIAQELCSLAGIRPGKALLESMRQSKSINAATALVREFRNAIPKSNGREIPSSSGKTKPVMESDKDDKPVNGFPKTKEELFVAMTNEAY
jgi:hypothetical protein